MINNNNISQFILQWHITELCNLKCKHCYQENICHIDPSLNEIEIILDKFKEFINSFGKIKTHINITGGEPFIRKDFLNILELFTKKNFFSYGILTNGTFITKEIAKELKKLKAGFVQISIEGDEKTHDEIRGLNNWSIVEENIKHLLNENIKTIASFTAHKNNFKLFPKAVKLISKLNIDYIWTDRLIPFGEGKNIDDLSIKETKEFFEIIEKQVKKYKDKVKMNRALQFLCGGDLYTCKAGKELLTLMPDGTVYPCRRMPVNIGNINSQSFKEIYNNELCLKLRDDTIIPKGCENCSFLKACQGGLRCLTYCKTGSPFNKDTGCFV